VQLVEKRLVHFQEPNLFFFRGLVRERRGDGEGARADYSRALDRSRRFHWQAALLLAALAGSI